MQRLQSKKSYLHPSEPSGRRIFPFWVSKWLTHSLTHSRHEVEQSTDVYRLDQCSPYLFDRVPHLPSRCIRGPSYHCWRRVSGWCPKLYIYILELILDRYEYIPVGYITVLHDLIVIKLIVDRFVGGGSFLITYSNGHTKYTSPIKEVSRLCLTKHLIKNVSRLLK